MEITYQEIQASLKLSHIVSSSVENTFQQYLKYCSIFTAISLPWFVSQIWIYHWAQVLVLIELMSGKLMKTILASCSQLEDAANQNITCLMGLSCMTQTPKLLYQQIHKIYYGLGYKYRIYPPSGVYGDNRSQSLPGSLKMNLLQFFVKNKTQITSWMEMKSLCCPWSSHHWVTAVC